MSDCHTLRPYQTDVFYAVMDRILKQQGLTFSVEIARPRHAYMVRAPRLFPVGQNLNN